MNIMRAILAASCAVTAVAGAANAVELTAASWVGPSHPTIRAGYNFYFPAVAEATGGAVTFKLISGGALMSGKETLTGLGDGIADASVLALTYNPAQLPASQLVSELAMLSGESLAVAAAVTEFTLLECAPCIAEFSEQNVVYTGSYATAPYALISKDKIESPADLEGKRVRTPGGAWDRWVAESGGTVVHTSSSEMYEAIDKGIIDVAMQPGAALKSFSLWDVADHITLADLGVYNSGPFLAFNKDAWSELSVENRRVLLDQLPEALVATTEAYLSMNDEALSETADHGVTVTEKPESLQTWVTEFNDQDLSAVIEKAESVYGIDGAEALVQAYSETLQKWTDRLDSGMSRDDLVSAMKTEIFDRIDAAAYGI
ncbi:TRAP-type C4-dicarboxylate transport system, substrate-binding protein [Salinihabitans flavidus]|uniref:TRAP-type C4-dicarboxylate transport system, substrate-binding protein n=1 Tax=Salinihabitans flavidus TaxID=569882 RepID=A0A1H8NU58_9RHOB|nr:C4-dicarboxylate TRAP transporter substrate-binding protein [Salinihabitans flavidus]SEO33175.1 TRAP-type C4-dicarboxylate transport system, substrate-binding protein [Salinihabitans flavidus]